MKIDSKRIRDERMRKAWSQEHLAGITGLGLRTIQRIEKSGAASHESVAALASVFAIPIEALLVAEAPRKSFMETLAAKRLQAIFGLAVVVTFVAPPDVTAQLAVMGGLWFVFELSLATLAR